MDYNSKTSDLAQQRVQKSLLRASFALAKACDALAEQRQTQSKTVTYISDAMGLNFKRVHDISKERRSKMFCSPNVNTTYRKLTSDEFRLLSISSEMI